MKKIYILIICCLGLQSCESWFDISPKSEFKAEDLFSTPEGFNDALTGVYSIMTLSYDYGAAMSYSDLDVLAQYYTIPATSNFADISNYRYTITAVSNKFASVWSSHYQAIANLNSMLSYVDGQKDMLGDGYHTIKGQALALRAYLHFDLLRLFAPNMTMGKDEKSIPYMSRFTNVAQPLETVESALARIIADLNDARELMRPHDSMGPNYLNDVLEDEPASVSSMKIRMSYYGATALLARVCLYAGKNSDALKAAKEIIGEPEDGLVPIFEMATSAEQGDPLFFDELIFALDKQNMEDETEPYFSDAAALSYNMSGSRYLRLTLAAKDAIYKTDSPVDVEYRKNLWFKVAGTAADYVTLSKYDNVKYIPMLRVSELYLIAAECAPDATAQLAYLNKFKAHRGLNPVTDMGTEIEKEYGREFIGEGQLFFYYKRKNMTKIGLAKSVTVDPQKIYRIDLPLTEQDLGNR